ncbi:hypothetical protein [Flavobacterium notoginsengisoli]|uniref:hypothetical protein n=2 Tax=Pseudomonadati TaxID=3379134 RepID=UPI00362CEF57
MKRIIIILFITVTNSFATSCQNSAISNKKSEKIKLEIRKTDKVFNGNLNLKTQKEVDAFGQKNYTYFNGNLSIGDTLSTELSGEIQNLDALKNIQKINGELLIVKLKNFHSVEGLMNLENVNGNFTISGCDLSKIDGFNKLISVNGDITFGNNSGKYSENPLIQISGFNNLVKVENIFIIGNSGLKKVDGFNQIKEIKTVMIMNSDITTLNCFKNLQTVNENFSVEYSDLLTSITLEKLETVNGFFALNENNTINGNITFPNLKLIKLLYFFQNKSFENYCSFSRLLKENKIAEIEFQGNKSNPSKEQIITNCK